MTATQSIGMKTLRTSALIALFTATTCAAQGVLVNGDFASNLTGWTIDSSSPLPTWSALDYQGNATSGSALLTNDGVDPNVRLYPLRQCIQILPGAYQLVASGYLASGHTGGRLVVSYGLRATADCSGGYYAGGGFYLESNGAWQQAGYPLTVQDRPVNSLEVLLGIEKDAAGGELQGNIDGVKVLGDDIFSDGFE